MNRLPMKGSEEYYIMRDEFVRYVDKEVNPARIAEQLSSVGLKEAQICFDIIYDFQSGWLK